MEHLIPPSCQDKISSLSFILSDSSFPEPEDRMSDAFLGPALSPSCWSAVDISQISFDIAYQSLLWLLYFFETFPRGLISYASCNEHWSADFAKVHSELPAHFTTDTWSCVCLQLPPPNNYIFFPCIFQSSHGWLSVIDSNSTGNRSGKRILGNVILVSSAVKRRLSKGMTVILP